MKFFITLGHGFMINLRLIFFISWGKCFVLLELSYWDSSEKCLIRALSDIEKPVFLFSKLAALKLPNLKIKKAFQRQRGLRLRSAIMIMFFVPLIKHLHCCIKLNNDLFFHEETKEMIPEMSYHNHTLARAPIYTVEPPRTVTSQQQPPPYNSQFLISPKYSFTIYLTSP